MTVDVVLTHGDTIRIENVTAIGTAGEKRFLELRGSPRLEYDLWEIVETRIINFERKPPYVPQQWLDIAEESNVAEKKEENA